jgi:uncharacterized protein YndB with AHSA1/START domain
MTKAGDGRVSVTRRIGAPPDRVFAVIANPARHPSFDGSGMLRDGSSNEPIRGVGDVFTMKMQNEEMGDYEMHNHVVEYELNRRIVWEPVLSAASRAEDLDSVGDRAGHRWGYELEPDGDATVVTETFDCSRAPDWLRGAVGDGEQWEAAMTATLDLLDVVGDLRRPDAGFRPAVR